MSDDDEMGDDDLDRLFALSEQRERERKKAEFEEVRQHLKNGVLPTPEPIARILAWRAFDRATLMREHPFWEEWKLRQGFHALVSTALTANLDLLRCEAALSAYASSESNFHKHVEATVENPAQKEVMAFCAAHFGTIDTLRRIKGRRPELADEIDRIRIASTDGMETAFILDLRKNLSHGSVIVPGWSITHDGTSSAGNMLFFEADLAFGSWSSSSKSFIAAQQDKGIPISRITSVCAKGLAALRKKLNILFARNRSDAEADYHDLEDLFRRTSSRQFLKVLLNGFSESGGDPYFYLHDFFSPEQIRHALRLPHRSKEQVEFLISQKIVDADCDDSLRQKIYEIFSVEPGRELEPEKPSFEPPPIPGQWRSITETGSD